MLEKDVYTVQEVSQIIGKSMQAVYSRLDNLAKDGKEYTITGKDGKKRVKKEFITDFYSDVVDQSGTAEQDIEALKIDLAATKARNSELEQQILQLTDRIKSQQKSIENLQQMNINNQLLLSQMSQNQTLLLQSKAEETAPADPGQTAETAPDEQTPKQGFWQRILKKKVE